MDAIDVPAVAGALSAKQGEKPGSAPPAGKRARRSLRKKYNARGEYVQLHDKRVFIPSAIQAVRLRQLIEMEQAEMIGNLKAEVRIPIVINNLKVFEYRCDHVYDVLDERGYEARQVYEEVKGFITPEYRLKKKVFEAVMQVKISEIMTPGGGTKQVENLTQMWKNKIPE